MHKNTELSSRKHSQLWRSGWSQAAVIMTTGTDLHSISKVSQKRRATWKKGLGKRANERRQTGGKRTTAKQTARNMQGSTKRGGEMMERQADTKNRVVEREKWKEGKKKKRCPPTKDSKVKRPITGRAKQENWAWRQGQEMKSFCVPLHSFTQMTRASASAYHK